jgi:glutathione S-transferase
MRIYAAKVANPRVAGFVRDLRPVWLLEELAAPYEIVWLDRASDENRKQPYLSINPFGKVPALEDEGFRLYESAAICAYLGDRFGRFIPAPGSRERALHDQWVSCALSNIEPHASRVFACEHFFARNDATATIRAGAAGELQRNLPVIDGHLAGQAFLMGPDPCVADIMLCSILRMIAGSELIAPLARLGAYMARLQARPAFQRALALNGGLHSSGA